MGTRSGVAQTDWPYEDGQRHDVNYLHLGLRLAGLSSITNPTLAVCDPSLGAATVRWPWWWVLW